uniref:Replication factor A C-terminal domain-containing protein n=1 Tax=Brassica oleracea var. oleracea TaxID=109376 RepID=A0A0D3D7D9_BRAOL
MAMVLAPKNRVSYVRELKPRRDTCRIEVKILRLLRNYNKESENTIEMGTRIHALVGKQLIKKYEDRPTEGDAVVVHLFKVYDAFGDYWTTTHPYKIGFFQTTFVGKADDFPSEVPEKYLADYNDILGGKLDNSCLVDVIGQIVNFGSLENKMIKEKDNIRLLIELRDQNLPNDSLALTNNDNTQWSVGTATSVRAICWYCYICSCQVGTFVTMATIESIDAERGWQYLSCKYCNKKVFPTTNVDDDMRPLFYCNTCDKEHINVVSRFKLIANVKDDSGEANFLLFDTNAQMTVCTAELYDEDEDPDFLPEAVSDLFGKRMLFEISVDSDNIRGKSSQYLVRCANDDREMIEEFAALPHKPVLMLLGSDEISDGSGGSSETPVSKRKGKGEEENDAEDQLSVKKKQGQKKIKGE